MNDETYNSVDEGQNNYDREFGSVLKICSLAAVVGASVLGYLSYNSLPTTKSVKLYSVSNNVPSTNSLNSVKLVVPSLNLDDVVISTNEQDNTPDVKGIDSVELKNLNQLLSDEGKARAWSGWKNE